MKIAGLIIIGCFISFFAYNQEICNNGIDDDSDGLIDINDSDCDCAGTGTVNPSSLIPNPSFEDMTCCPASYSMLFCADTWIQASDATSDFLHTCDFITNTPMPIPDGNGVAGFIISEILDYYPYIYLEYLGACLTDPMVQGTEYTMQFEIAFDWAADGSQPATGPTESVDITLYGTPNCSDIPWTGYECPIGVGGFVELGSVNYFPIPGTGWSTLTITFTPAFDVYAIALGGPCEVPADDSYLIDAWGTYHIPYFFMDNLTLNESSMFNPVSITQTGSLCTNDLVLTCEGGGTGDYQWYFNGVAISGETGISLNASLLSWGEGDYQVMFSNTEGCSIAETTVNDGVLIVDVSDDQSICNGEDVSIFADCDYTIDYVWNNGLPNGPNHTVSPSATTTYTVSVSNGTGCTGSADIVITVNPLPVPDISGELEICPYETTVLSAGTFSLYDWSNDFTTGTIEVNQDGNYAVTVTDINGCTGTDNVNVVVNPVPVPVVSDDISVCSGTSGHITASGGISYLWDNGLGGGASHDVSPLTTTIYNVTVSDANGCTATDNIVVAVFNSPVITVNPVEYTLCRGNNIELIASGADTYEWSPAAGLNTTAGSTVVASPETTTVYVVTGSINGCTGTAQATVNIENFEISVSAQSHVCAGTTIPLIVSVSGGTMPYTYHWDHIAPTVNASITETIDNDSDFSVYVSDVNGCISETETIHVEVPEPLQIIANCPDDYICPGENTSINALISGGVGSPYYCYLDGELTVLPVVVSPSSTTDYIIVAEDLCGTRVQDIISVEVKPAPDVDFQANLRNGCVPLEVTFTSLFEASEYFWNFGNGHLSNSMNPTCIFENAGLFSVELSVVSEFGCENTLLVQDYIDAYPLPEAGFVPDELIVSIVNTSVFFENTSYLADTSYWNFGDGNYTNVFSPLHVFPNDPNVDYEVQLIVASQHGCRDTVAQIITVLDEITFYAPTSFSPNNNGINDVLKFFGNGIVEGTTKAFIYDRWGELINESYNFDYVWDGRVKGKGHIAPSGVYTWLAEFEDTHGNKRQYAGVVTLLR